jgi:hypothetical protein
MTRWFRLYDDVLNDPKVQKLNGELFKLWINVLCIASKHGGVLPSLDDLAFELRLPTLVCKTEIDMLKAAGLIDGDKKLKPHGWEKRQYKSDTSTDRVKRFRERSRNVTETVSETAPDTDTETDTETDKNQKKIPKKRDRSAGSAEFENFWSVYPRKINRAVALKAFEKATRKTEADLIITAVQGYKFADDEQFIPHPATWLNQERWVDGTPTSVRPQVTEAEKAVFLEEHQQWLKEFRKKQLAD